MFEHLLDIVCFILVPVVQVHLVIFWYLITVITRCIIPDLSALDRLPLRLFSNHWESARILCIGHVAVVLYILSSHLIGFRDPLLALLPQLGFVFVSTVNQAIDLLDQVAQTVLLLTERLMHSIEAIHETVEVLILFLTRLLLIVRVQLDNFILPLLHVFELLLLLGCCDEIRQLGLLFALSNLYDDSHDHILDRDSSLLNLLLLIMLRA